MASHVLSTDRFAKIIRLVTKTFSFCNFCDVFVKKEKNLIKNTRNHHEKAKIQLVGYCKRASYFFCIVCKSLFPKRKPDSHF